MQLDINDEFEKSKSLLDTILRPLHWFGIWSPQRSIMDDVKFSILVTYFTIHLVMMCYDLIMVFGDLESIVLNLMESGVQSIFMLRVLVLRFRKHFNLIVISLRDEISDGNYKDSFERNTHVEFSSMARFYDRIVMTLGIISSFSWYLMPLQNYILAWLFNGEMTLNYPYRMFGGNNSSSTKWNVIIYIYQTPVTFFPICYLSSYGLMMMAIIHICEHMAILSYRINNLSEYEKTYDVLSNLMGEFVEKRTKALRLTKIIADGFDTVLLYELIITTVLVSLISYNILLNIDNFAVLEIATSTLFVISIMAVIYGYCFMGQFLITESENLAAACYGCAWHEMPIHFQRSLLIFMKSSQIPLQLTAGRFYVYSYRNFTNIMKSSAAYVSMLRAVI
uniref:Odorant receptor n=1 Tax=Meteorus pulchricornis TaxID=51522 RepID=A0A1S5VFL3_9HYME|nr:olfactory receptor 27 [Meteorus pulchricornis]